MKTVALPEDLHKELVKLKLELGNKNTAKLIEELILSYKEQKFFLASELFRKKLREKGISFSELLKRSRKIKEEIADEWF